MPATLGSGLREVATFAMRGRAKRREDRLDSFSSGGVMKTQRRWLGAIALAVVLPAAAQEKADLLLYNGKVLTVDSTFSIKNAVVVKDGRIVAIGGNELAN